MSDLKQKIFKKMEAPTLGVFATLTKDGLPWARYVVVKAEENLDIFFATFRESRKISQIHKNPNVHLTVGAEDFQNVESYLQIQGTALILDSKKIKAAVWYDQLEKIFSGPDDPTYVVCKISPKMIEFNNMNPEDPPEIWTAS